MKKETLSVRDLSVGLLLGFMGICVLTAIVAFAIYFCMGGSLVFLTISKWAIFIGFFTLMTGGLVGAITMYSE